MIRFKKYSSIENNYNKSFIERLRDVVPPEMQFVVQEKVHGANICFLCDGKDVVVGKRNGMIEDGENFYNYHALLERYRPRIFQLMEHILHIYNDVQEVIVYGEMFGGNYPHPMVRAVRESQSIQKGVYYAPYHEFYAFDIYVISPSEERYLSVPICNHIFEKTGFFFARTLFQGTLEECLAHPNLFQSHIADWLELPAINDNICEGIVIRSIIPLHTALGERVILKSKNSRFAEKKSVKKYPHGNPEKIPRSVECEELLAEMDTLVNDNRLVNVLGKTGEVEVPREIGRLIGLLAHDAFEEFFKLFLERYDQLPATERHVITRELNRMSARVVKEHYGLLMLMEWGKMQ